MLPCYVVPSRATADGGIEADIDGVDWVGHPSVDGTSYLVKASAAVDGLDPLPRASYGDYPAWAVGVAYAVGDVVTYQDVLYSCVQAHTSQSNWQPPNVPALWNVYDPPGVVPEWRQPLGSTDAYAQGAVVHHNSAYWQSLVAANVWEPGVAEWTQIDGLADTAVARGLKVSDVTNIWAIEGES